MSDETFDVAAFAAQATGTVGIADDADHSTPVPNALADDLDAYADHAQRQRDAQMAEDAGDPQDETEQEAPVATDKRTVPLGALHEERSRRQALEQQLAAQQAQLIQFQQWQAQLAQAQQQAQLEAEIPDFESDPQGHLEGVKAQMQRELQGMQQQLQAQHQQAQFSAQLQAEVTAIAPTVTAAEDALREEVGGEVYDAAYQHVHQYAQAEIARMYPGAPPAVIAQLEQVAGIAFVQQCQQQGIDPARHIFEKAQALGFVQPGHRVPGQERRAPNTSLSTIPAAGRAPDQRGRLTAKDIATMPQDEFDAMFESMRKSSVPMPI